MDKEKVLKLATLARIEMGETEAEKLSREFESILKYVSEVQTLNAGSDAPGEDTVLKNVLREDGEPHESGIYTEKILNEAPAREGGYLKVKKIL